MNDRSPMSKTISRQIELVRPIPARKFESVRIDNYRLYLMGGVRYANDLVQSQGVGR